MYTRGSTLLAFNLAAFFKINPLRSAFSALFFYPAHTTPGLAFKRVHRLLLSIVAVIIFLSI